MRELLTFLEIDRDTQAAAWWLSDLLECRVDGILNDLYDNLLRLKSANESEARDLPALKADQKRHWLSLFQTTFDERYCAEVRRLAIRHRDFGLSPMWYAASYIYLGNRFKKVIKESNWAPEADHFLLSALDKYIAVDQALALSTYGAFIVS